MFRRQYNKQTKRWGALTSDAIFAVVFNFPQFRTFLPSQSLFDLKFFHNGKLSECSFGYPTLCDRFSFSHNSILDTRQLFVLIQLLLRRKKNVFLNTRAGLLLSFRGYNYSNAEEDLLKQRVDEIYGIYGKKVKRNER